MPDIFDKQRILELSITADESDDSVVVTAVKYYRNRQSLVDQKGFAAEFTAGAAAGTHEVVLGEVLPPPNVIRIKSTFQA